MWATKTSQEATLSAHARRPADQMWQLLSGSVFVLASLLLLGLLLVPNANYYQNESDRHNAEITIARANEQLSRALQAAYMAHADSILYLAGQPLALRSTCASPRACLEESLARMLHEVENAAFAASYGPEARRDWEQGRMFLQQ